jgi:hypothetical protein
LNGKLTLGELNALNMLCGHIGSGTTSEVLHDECCTL